jgi:hypothetical protein
MFKKKCVLCKARDKTKNMKSVEYFGWDYVNKHYFHPECLKDIICNPGTYKTSTVDDAIYIHKELRKAKKKEEVEQNQSTLECLK